MVYCYTPSNSTSNSTDTTQQICETSNEWNKWGRWVAIGILIFAFVSLIAGFLLFAYLSSRRRIRSGLKPHYGTTWAAPPPYSPNDPHPSAPKEVDLEMDDSPAPSYREATESSASPESYLSSTATTPQVNVATVAVVVPPPGRVADPDGRREF